MAIKAIRLKEAKIPEKTAMYEVRNSRDIVVEEIQKNGSCDRVTLRYCVENDDIGYFAREYRPEGVPKEGAKVIDITAAMLNRGEKKLKWYLYDIKDTLAGDHTVVKLHDQWNAGLQYLKQNILDQKPEYLKVPDLGVITRFYDEKRMERLRDYYQGQCDEIENFSGRMSLAQQKKRVNIGEYRGYQKAAQAILDRKFCTDTGDDTYIIHIRYLNNGAEGSYQMDFSV